MSLFEVTGWSHMILLFALASSSLSLHHAWHFTGSHALVIFWSWTQHFLHSWASNYWIYTSLCPDPTQVTQEKGSGVTSPSLWAWSLVTVSVGLQVLFVKNLIWVYNWSNCSHFCIISINATLQWFHWFVHASGASPRINLWHQTPSPCVSWPWSGHETRSFIHLCFSN